LTTALGWASVPVSTFSGLRGVATDFCGRDCFPGALDSEGVRSDLDGDAPGGAGGLQPPAKRRTAVHIASLHIPRVQNALAGYTPAGNALGKALAPAKADGTSLRGCPEVKRKALLLRPFGRIFPRRSREMRASLPVRVECTGRLCRQNTIPANPNPTRATGTSFNRHVNRRLAGAVGEQTCCEP